MIVCDREHLGLVDATRAPQRLRPPDRELRGRARGRRARPRPDARGVHPGAVDRGRTAPRSRCWPASTATRWSSARASVVLCAFHPELTDDSRLHALLMAIATAARERAASDRRRSDERRGDEGPAGRQPGPDPGPLLDRGQGGRDLRDRGLDRRRAADRRRLRGGPARRAGIPVVAISFEGQAATFFKHASDAQLEWVSPLARVGGRARPTAGSRSAPTPTPASSPASPPSARPSAARRPGT